MPSLITLERGTAIVQINRTLFCFFSPKAYAKTPYYQPPISLYWLEFFDDQGRRFFVAGGFYTIEPAKHLAEKIAKSRLQWNDRGDDTEAVCDAKFRTDAPVEGFIMNGQPLDGIAPRR